MLGLVCFVTTLVEFQRSQFLLPKEEYSINVKNWNLPARNFYQKLFKISPEHIKIQITCYKLQSNETKAVSLIRLSLWSMRHLPQEAVLPYRAGVLCILTSSSRTRHWWSPNQTVSLGWTWKKENTEKKYCLQVTKKKEKFCGRWELKTGWEGTGGRAEHRGRTKQPSSAHSSQRISRLGVVQAAPHWCLQDSGLCPPAAKVSTWGLDMILQHFGGPVPSTFQLLQGKLHTTVLLMVIIPVFSLFMSLAFS